MKKLLFGLPVLPFIVMAGLLLILSFVGGELVTIYGAAIVGFIFAHIAFSIILIVKRPQRLTASSRRWQTVVALACLAVFISVPITHWPFRMAYQISRPEFDRIARELQAGKSFPRPMRAGVFWIKQAKVEEFNGVVCLWTELEPSGRLGFVLHPPDKVPFNLWSQIELDERWQYISED